MKTQHKKTFWLGIFITGLLLLTIPSSKAERSFSDKIFPVISKDGLMAAAFEILDTRCNSCHRKKNPFMIFNKKNMSKRAPKIYKMVYVKRTMPKGKENRLSHEQMATLQKWLFTQNIF